MPNFRITIDILRLIIISDSGLLSNVITERIASRIKNGSVLVEF